MRLFRLPKRDPSRFRDETPLARLIRLAVIVVLMGGVAWGLWLNNERRIARMAGDETAAMVDRTGLLSPEQEKTLVEYCERFRAAYGYRLILSIRSTPFAEPVLRPDERAGTVFFGLCPPARQTVLEVPPLLRTNLGPAQEEILRLLRDGLARDRWPEGLNDALNLLTRTLDAQNVPSAPL